MEIPCNIQYKSDDSAHWVHIANGGEASRISQGGVRNHPCSPVTKYQQMPSELVGDKFVKVVVISKTRASEFFFDIATVAFLKIVTHEKGTTIFFIIYLNPIYINNVIGEILSLTYTLNNYKK